MEKEFVPYDLALRLKNLGFDEDCFAYYTSKGELSTHSDEYEVYLINNDKWISSACSAPTWQSAFRFFREKYKLFGEILTDCTTYPKFCYSYSRFIGNPDDLTSEEWGWEDIWMKNSMLYKTYEEAQEGCLIKFCEIVELEKE